MHQFIFDPKDFSREDQIKFNCYKGIVCFNRCCYDVKLVLTPYDFLRLRRALNLSVEEFVEKFGEAYIGEVTQLPVISINMDPYSMACPFLDEKEGCKVYQDRPSSCRLYPLARYISQNENGEKQEIFKIIRETHCKGHYEERSIKIIDYLKEQGLEEYLYYNDLWGEVVSKRQKFLDTPLTADLLEWIFLFSYNLPELKEMIRRGEVAGFSKEDLELSEEKLLEKGIVYIRDVLLSEENLW
ncbi:YkgJ family cysteine cluster protein [Thermodesulfobacterium sp. TA1]|uniref:YkgJ family cysteine cluster protein n=1 Tax=Thermodesulfobacterium sp. TA1 TaxID=2234087 RepID=UPI0012319A2A|nr:YkgJ family cysteine cluster protein [Thermodesulfobacterium sp. TA1]QER41798.1 YkgJ family cysteine cluster protein [Thermodesulfobacterium sp. TA1]